MEYLSKKRIKEKLVPVLAAISISLAICGCGIQPAATIDTQDTIPETEKVNNSSPGSSYKETARDTSASTIIHLPAQHSKNGTVPVYGKDQQAKIKKYLASLPDNLTVKEARAKGIVIENYDYRKKNKFKKMWTNFFKYVQKGEKAHNPRYNAATCYAEPYKRAIVIAGTTVEGDYCYTYLSFIGGEYFVFEDYSRDKFRGSSSDGYESIGVFRSLRKYTDLADKQEDICQECKYYFKDNYYLFKEQDISNKKAKKIIRNKDYAGYEYYTDYFNVYEYVYSDKWRPSKIKACPLSGAVIFPDI